MDSEELMGPRVPKEQVIAGIIEDLEFAETHIPLKSKLPTDVGRLTKGAAQAMLARVALYIGTWNKFHGSGEYKSYLQIAKEASKRLIDSKDIRCTPITVICFCFRAKIRMNIFCHFVILPKPIRTIPVSVLQ